MKVVAVCSGKGGVGKTTVSLAIAKSLASDYNVGFFDGDQTGANAHLAVKLKKDMEVSGDLIIPAIAEIDGRVIQFLSIALISESYVRWSDSTVSDFVDAAILKTDWDCDYLILDTAPGSHIENIKALEYADCVILVTIPSRFAESDLLRTIDLIRDMNKPIAGLIVNLSYIKCPECGKEIRPFDYKPSINVPVIQELPFGDFDIDKEKLLKAIENPVILPKSKVSSKIKRKALYVILRTLGKLP